MTTLVKALGKAVYIGGNDMDNFSQTSVFITEDIESFRKILNNLLVSEEENLKAAHGILTSAVSIPNNIPVGTEIFLILPEANTDKESFIIEIESLYLLQKVIEAMVCSTVLSSDEVEDVMDYVASVEEQKIENIFILYGYGINLTYNISESECKTLDIEKKHKSLESLLERQTCK